ncbi:exonuclease domain-containing protein [Bacillus thermotolerans]|uniref:exonuclease domain-containing protein n=1 Tax=Bacillus thermotolerans TaxID=1221996 RepID=UPI00057CE801|nr:exonuclease domain-containing protein [Bacillus thermotolerans]KKB36665.1 DNA polymerase III alpha subunit [Bacillus thermotolerans]KKB39906.1 DNA polymerase III alpha subunit [Bacillus thermotolerans]
MNVNSFIHWMKQTHGKVSSAVYAPIAGQNRSQQQAFLRSLEKEKKNSLYVPLDKLKVVVFDFETTGFSPEQGDQILSVGAVKLEGWLVKEEQTFYSLVQFSGDLSPKIKQLTGLEEADLREAPPLREVLLKFYQYAGGDVLVAHHASHEKRFLEQATWKLFRTSLKHRLIDTSFVFKLVDTNEQLIRLEDYCQHCGIEVNNRHHALGDARLAAKLWSIYINKLYQDGCYTLKDIYERLAVLSR